MTVGSKLLQQVFPIMNFSMLRCSLSENGSLFIQEVVGVDTEQSCQVCSSLPRLHVQLTLATYCPVSHHRTSIQIFIGSVAASSS